MGANAGMSNTLSPELLAEIFAQESGDPFLTLVTLSHPSFASDIRLVNNTVNITSRGNVFTAFPMKIRLPMDDGETQRDFALEMDNASLELIEEIRTVTTRISVKFEMILASLPDDVQMSQEDLAIVSLNYTARRISARIAMDSFLGVEITSEKYTYTNFPGIF
jgi:hypothetical protein